MKSIYYNSAEFWRDFANYVRLHNGYVGITTYNMYTAIGNYKDKDGNVIPGLPKVMHPTQQILTDLSFRKHHIISCLKPKEHKLILDKWPYLKLRFCENLHVKMAIVIRNNRPMIYTGSCNFTMSTYNDIMMRVPKENCRELLLYYKDLLKLSSKYAIKNKSLARN